MEATFAVKNIESPSFLINFLASNSETVPEGETGIAGDRQCF